MNSVKVNLKRLRLERKLTQDELAARLHVVRQTVSSWETGKTTPDVETLTAIAQALEVEVSELIYGPRPRDTRPLLAKRAGLFLWLAAVCVVLAMVWSGLLTALGLPDTVAADFNIHALSHRLHWLGSVVFPLLSCLCAGAALGTLTAMGQKLAAPLAALGRWPRALGTVLLLCHLLAVISSLLLLPAPEALWKLVMWLVTHPWVAGLSGILLTIGQKN